MDAYTLKLDSDVFSIELQPAVKILFISDCKTTNIETKHLIYSDVNSRLRHIIYTEILYKKYIYT